MSPLHFDCFQSQARPCCKQLPKGTHGTYRKSALYFASKSRWPARPELRSFVPDSTAPSVVTSGSSLASRFGGVREGSELVVLKLPKKKQVSTVSRVPAADLPYSPTMPIFDESSVGGDEDGPGSRDAPAASANLSATLLAQAAQLTAARALGRSSSHGSRHANAPANRSQDQGSGPGGSQPANLETGSQVGQGGSQLEVGSSHGGNPGGQDPASLQDPSQTSQSVWPALSESEADDADPSGTEHQGGHTIAVDPPLEAPGDGKGSESEESLFPNSPISVRSRASLVDHRGPGFSLKPFFKFQGLRPLDKESGDPTPSGGTSSQVSQLQLTSQEVTLSLQPGQEVRSDPESDQAVESVHMDLKLTAEETRGNPDSSKPPSQNPCDGRTDPASGKDTQVSQQMTQGKGKELRLPAFARKSTKRPKKVDTGLSSSQHDAGRGKAGGHHKTWASAEGVGASQRSLSADGTMPRPSQATGNLEVSDPRLRRGLKDHLSAMELSITVPTVHPEGGQAVRRVAPAGSRATGHHSSGLERGRASQGSGHPEGQRAMSAPGTKVPGRHGQSSRDRSARGDADSTSKWQISTQLPQDQSGGLTLWVSFAGVPQQMTFIPFYQGRFASLQTLDGKPEELRRLLLTLVADEDSQRVLTLLPGLAIQLVARSTSRAVAEFTQLLLPGLSSQTPPVESQQPMEVTRNLPLTKRQRRREREKALLREIQGQSQRGLPVQEEDQMTFGRWSDPYGDSAGEQVSSKPKLSETATQAQVQFLEPLTQVIGEFKETMAQDREERRSIQRHQPPIPGTSDPLGPFDLTPPEGYEIPGVFKVMPQEQSQACRSFHNSCPIEVLPFKEGRSLSELSSQVLSSKQAQEFPDKMDDLAKEIWDRMAQDVSEDPLSWESAATPGTAPGWNLPAEPDEPRCPQSYHHDLDKLVTDTPVESTKTYTGLPASHRARRVLQHVAFGKEADKPSTLSACVHLPKADYKTLAKYSLSVTAQEEKILGQRQPIKAGKLESQEKVVTALRDEQPGDKVFFADTRTVQQHQTDAMKAGLAAHSAVEASAYLAAEVQRNLLHRLTQMESAGAIAAAEARGIRSAVEGDLALLQTSLLYADTAALASVDSQARAARVDQLRAREKTARVMLHVKAEEKDSQLLQAVKALPVIPASLFGGRFFNAVEGLASDKQRAEAASALVEALGRGYKLKLELDSKAKGTKRQGAGTSGGPQSKKAKGSATQSGSQHAGGQGGKQQPKAKPAAGRGQQQQPQATSSDSSSFRGRGRRHRGGRGGKGARGGSGGAGRGKSSGQQ